MTLLNALLQTGSMESMPTHMHHVATQPPDLASIPDHHLAGYVLLLLAALAFLGHSRLAERVRWLGYLFPLPLIGLGFFLLFRRDDIHVWPSQFFRLQIAETVVQHKLFESAAIAIGCIELARRLGWLKSPAWAHLVSVLMLGGGAALLFHGGQHSPIVHVEHRWMSCVIIALGLAKMASDLQPGSGRTRPWLAGYVVPLLFLVLGLQFALYVE